MVRNFRRRLSGKFVGSLSMLTPPPLAVRRQTLPIPTSVFDSIHVLEFTDFRRRVEVSSRCTHIVMLHSVVSIYM